MVSTWARLAAAGVLAAAGSACLGQVYRKSIQNNPGQLLDASPQIGSGGYNVGSGLGSYGSYALDSQLYITGQVSGLARFRGSVPYRSPSQFQIDLPSASLSDFSRQSVGLRDITGGGTYGARPYYEPSTTVLRAPAIVSGLAQPGTNMPRDAVIDTSLGTRLRVDALAEYRAMLSGRPGTGLSAPMETSSLPTYVPTEPATYESPGAPGRERQQEQAEVSPFRGMLFSLPSEGERTALARQLAELDRRQQLGVTADARVDASIFRDPNADQPADPNQFRSVTVRDLPQQPDRSKGPAERGPQLDAYAIWKLLTEGPADLGPSAEPNAGLPAEEPGRGIVELQDGQYVFHTLAGRAPVDRYMVAGEERLRDAKFYEAADAYALAAIHQPTNPLPRLGRSLAFLGAGEPLTAADELLTALGLDAALMTVRVDLERMISRSVLASRLEELDQRLAESKEPTDSRLSLLACFLHRSAGHDDKAKDHASRLRETAAPGSLMLDYAQFVLTGKRPTTQPAPTTPGLP